MKESLKMVGAILFAGILFVPFSEQAFAQDLPTQRTKVDDRQLRSFAKVYVQAEKIRQSYEPRAKEAKNPDEGSQIQHEAQAKFQAALDKEGLSEEGYSQIVQMARADEELRKKVLQMIADERAKS